MGRGFSTALEVKVVVDEQEGRYRAEGTELEGIQSPAPGLIIIIYNIKYIKIGIVETIEII